MSAPAIITYSMEHITAALNAADELGVSVYLLSAPSAAASLGSSVFQAMIEEACARHPDTPFSAAIDCGDDAGHALAAIRQGIGAIVLSKECPAIDRVCDIADQKGVSVLPASIYAEAGDHSPLNLSDHTDPLAACREFLHTKTNTSPLETP